MGKQLVSKKVAEIRRQMRYMAGCWEDRVQAVADQLGIPRGDLERLLIRY